MAESTEGGNGKARRRPAVKAANGQAAAKVKATIHLSVEADKRLSIHSTMMEMDRSELVEFLIVTHLKRYIVQDRAKPDGDTTGEAAA
jgi:hypothetical protein